MRAKAQKCYTVAVCDATAAEQGINAGYQNP